MVHSMDSTLLFDKIRKNLDLSVAMFVFISSLFLIILSKSNRTSALPILIMFIAVIYGLLKKDSRDFEIRVKSKKSIMLLNDIMFVFLFIIYIYYNYTTQYPYDLLYFILLSLIASSILYSIFSSKNTYNWIILLKINLLTLLCVASNYYASPEVYGIDPLFHSRFCEQIISLHHLPTMNEFSAYYFYPILHIYTSELNIISSLTIQDSFFIIGILESIITSFLIYLIASMNPRNDGQVGLLSAYLYCGSSMTLPRSWIIIPNSFGIILFCLIIYLILKNSKKKVSISLIFLILFLSLVLTHPYPALILIAIMIIISSSYSIWNIVCNNHVAQKFILSPLNSLVLLCIVYLAQLVIRANNPQFIYLLSSLPRGYWWGSMPIQSIVKPLQYTMYNSLSHNIVFIFTLFAVFTWLNNRFINIKRVIIILMYLFMVSMIYISPIFNIGSIPIPVRIWQFAYIPGSVLGAYGIIYFVRTAFKRYKKSNYIIASIILLCIYFLSITSSIVSPDGGFYSDETEYRVFLTDSELAGFNHLIKCSNEAFQSDYYYNIYFKYKGYNQKTRWNMDPSIKHEDPVLLREYFLNKPSIRYQSYFPKTKNTQISQTDFEKIMEIENKNIVYKNGNVWIYS